jgi:hypothetical protein
MKKAPGAWVMNPAKGDAPALEGRSTTGGVI